jgi:hypothetical protein
VKARWSLNLLLVLGLCRYLWLAGYMHPYADDLSYAYTAFQQPFLERMAHEYQHWNGRLASNILVLRGPLIIGYPEGLFWYRMVPALWIFGMVGAWLLLLRTAGPRHVPGEWTVTLALGLTALWLNILPDLTEGFYWSTGAVTYTLPHILLLILVAALVRVDRAGTPLARGCWYALISMLGIWIVWSNEVHLVLLVLASPLLLIFREGRAHGGAKCALVVVLLFIGAAVLSIIAPGNAARASHFVGGGDVLHTAGWTALQTLRFIATWTLSPALLLASIAVLLWMRQHDDDRIPRIPFHWSRWAAALIAVVVVSVALPYWATGMLGQHRTVNAAWSIFLPLWGVLLVAVHQQVLRPRAVAIPVGRSARRSIHLGLVLAFLISGNDGRVAHDLLTGAAARNAVAWEERFAAVQAAAANGVLEVRFDPLPARTAALHIMELDSLSDHWTNKAVAHYLNAPAVRISVAQPHGQRAIR